ncbi:MAG TPA: hypothetical protein VHD87_09465 [Acidimicrobiales bacterium]|nr:hypothetical protein [Acidimicrobiales bacterium]
MAAAWERGVDRDWSARAGTVEWSCTKTAEHAFDAVLAVGFFLASRRQDRYPDTGGVIDTGKTPWPSQLIEAMTIAGRMVAGVVATTPEDATAIIWRRPEPTVAPPSEFAPRAGLEMILHGHDVAAGLGVKYEPPEGLVIRLRDHTRGWPHWSSPGWRPVARTGDPWADLLEASGRARFVAY